MNKATRRRPAGQNWLSQAAALGLFSLCVTVQQAYADVIYLKNGETQAGVITQGGQNSPRVTLRTVAGEITIPMERVQRIEAESPSASYVRLGDLFLQAARVPEALDAYRRAVEADPSNAAAAAKLQEAQGAQAAQQQAAVQATVLKTEEAISRARELTAQKKFQEALNLLRSAEPSEGSPQAAMYNKATADLYYLWGVDRADHQDVNGAIEKFQMTMKLDPANDAARQALVRAFEGDPSKLEEISNYYLTSDVPADQVKAADAFFKLRQFDKALPIYLKYANEPGLGTDIMRDRVRFIYNNLHETAARQGDYNRALQLYRELAQFDPAADPGTLVRCEYMIRRSETNMNDPAARATLARWAEENNMALTARQEYTNIHKMAPDNPEALAGLKRFAAADLQDAQDYFGQTQYTLAYQKAADVAQMYNMFPDVVAQAQQIQTKSQVEHQKQSQNRRQQAQALALRGDDSYNQAMTYLSAYASTEINRNVRVFSPREEATKFFRQAVYAWQLALSIDPSLGDPTSYNLNWKIADASSKLLRIGNRIAPALPRRDTNRLPNASSTN